MIFRRLSCRPLLSVVGLLLLSPSLAPAAVPESSTPVQETPAERDARMGWWRDARFGMFIHWGLYAIPAGQWNGKPVDAAGEWIMFNGKIPLKEYESLQKQFNPVKFDAAKWAKIAKDAGMKYVVITSKHHDGFCLFDSKLTDYDVMSTPFRRDIMKELAEAVRDQGLTMCWYHSILDWHHPDYLPRGPGSRRPWDTRPTTGADLNRYVDYMKGQLRELLTNYGPIGVVWFDGGWDHTAKELHAEEVVRMMRGIQPKLIVNNRINLPLDFDTPEQTIPPTGIPGRDWETCMTMNDTWGFKKDDHNWKSTETLIRNLIDIVSKGGNYLLNVGPTAEGEIPPESVERLEAMGRWMKTNGEAIYGTTASPFLKLAWGRCTQKPGKLFLHVFDWPKNGELFVPGLKNKVKQAYLLADAVNNAKVELLETTQSDDGVTVKLPAEAPDKIASVVVLEIEGPAEVEPPSIRQSAGGSVFLPAVEAVIHGKTARYESGEGKDNVGYWSDAQEWVSWDLKIKRPGTFRVKVIFACEDGVEGGRYAVEIAGQKLTGTVESTGDWTMFETADLGTVRLDAGRHTLVVRPVEIPHGALMNLQAVVLRPE
ncbi:MAG: alpha-L-fucosidase [Pirellulales bacterium]|nr:alpha-L-fucosidase [Pirellulales bacterium]